MIKMVTKKSRRNTLNISVLIFYIIAALIIVMSLMVVRSTNLVHSALYMVGTFFGVACIYLMLYADFIAVVQIIVYVVSISIMMIFGVMLTRRGDICESNNANRFRGISAIVVLALFLIIVRFITLTGWTQIEVEQPETTVYHISELLMNRFVVPFEVSSILLLVALIGAISIGKGLNSQK